MRVTNRQERQTFTRLVALAQMPDLLGHTANPYPAWPVGPAWAGEWTEEGHGLWLNGGNRVSLFCLNPTALACSLLLWRQVTPLADWVVEPAVTIAAGTAGTSVFDLGGYAVRVQLLSNVPNDIDVEFSAVIHAVP